MVLRVVPVLARPLHGSTLPTGASTGASPTGCLPHRSCEAWRTPRRALTASASRRAPSGVKTAWNSYAD